MKIEHIDEPELLFGSDQKHVDIRFGLAFNGPHDLNQAHAPTSIRVGIVGTQAAVELLTGWLNRSSAGIAAKKSRLENLFPGFPGFNTDGCFHSRLVCTATHTRLISTRQVDDIARHSQQVAIADAVDLLFTEMRELLSKTPCDVILCAIPETFLHLDNEEDDELVAEIETSEQDFETKIDLRSYLKAKTMQLGVPIQLLLPATYGDDRGRGRAKKRLKRNEASPRALQDEATRAWNLYTAIYYKAGGRPWRIPTAKSDLLTCYVGVSFYRTLEQNTLQTSVAQVYNERGEGVIVRGATVTVSKDDPVPHLSSEAAQKLLSDALSRFKDEHKTLPARVVLHKTSNYSSDELEGFSRVTRGVYMADFLTIEKTFLRLFRQGNYPTLRGTLLSVDDNTAVLYTKGSVPFFSTYPGLYVPRPLMLKRASGETSMRSLATETLALSKMNWNNTQFDGGLPITLRVAQQVGRILKYVPEGHAVQSRYAFYM